jgi:hypothetical protein
VPGTVNEHSGHYDPNTHTLSFQYEPYWGPNSNSASLSFFSIANVIPTHPGPTEFEAFASRIAAGEQNIEAFGLQVGLQVAGGILGRTIGAGIDALVAAKAAATEVSEVADLVAKAAGTVGNQSARASSKATALAAAEEWVGPGAKTLVDRNTGQIAGKISADGTKVYRITSLNKAQPYVNLESKMTGGNLHVRF